jgi:hypothetical protein
MAGKSMKLTAFTNNDKDLHSTGGLIPGFPSRIGLFAPPSRGKRSACLNLIARQKPSFDTFTVCHWDAKTTEYSILDDQPEFKVLGWGEQGLPEPTSFDRKKRNALILDELPWDSMTRAEHSKLERLFNFGSTHHSITIYLQAQDVFSVPISVRRALTHICIWPSPIRLTTSLYSRMLGINLQEINDRLCKDRYSFIMLDFTGDGPPVRLNAFQVIEGYTIRRN